jgi:hypothetical protein
MEAWTKFEYTCRTSAAVIVRPHGGVLYTYQRGDRRAYQRRLWIGILGPYSCHSSV